MSSLITSDAVIERDPEVVSKAVRALVKTQQALKADVSLATKVGEKWFPELEASLIAHPFLSDDFLERERGLIVAIEHRGHALREDRPGVDPFVDEVHGGAGDGDAVGARVAELQLTTLISELQKRRLRVNVLEEPTRVPASFVHGYKSMMVELSQY